MQIRLARIKGDILCELVAVSIIRSEFETADKVGLFFVYITLNPHFAPGTQRPDRAYSHVGCV